jgi:hypothetical protein
MLVIRGAAWKDSGIYFPAWRRARSCHEVVLVGRHHPIGVLQKLCDCVELGVVRILSAARRIEPRLLPTSDPGTSRASPECSFHTSSQLWRRGRAFIFARVLCAPVSRDQTIALHNCPSRENAMARSYVWHRGFFSETVGLTHQPITPPLHVWMSGLAVLGMSLGSSHVSNPHQSATRALLFMK